MANEDAVKQLEARLTRLESILAQLPSATATGGFTPPGGAVVDQSPFANQFANQFANLGQFRLPHPVVDPATFAWTHGRWPTPVVDPAPWPSPVVDPATFPGALQTRAATAASAATLGRIGQIGDPAPIDVSRFTLAQLEATLHSINAEKARLASMETMVSQQLNKLKQQGPQQG